MKKLIHESFHGERSMVGVSEEVIWKLTDYYGGPKKDGEYTVSDGDGSIRELCFATDGLTLFNQYMTNFGLRHEIKRINLEEYLYEDLTNDELIELCKSHDVWYDTDDDYQDDEYFGCDIIIFGSGWGDHKKGYVPKYFLEKTLTGPIDSDLETMEEEVRE